jgi:hypothetical protein
MSRELQRASLFFKYIREEHAHHIEILERGKQQLLEALKYVKADPNAQARQQNQQQSTPPQQRPDESEKPPVPDDVAVDVKKLYKKIVQETHPDRLAQTDHSQKEREKRVKMYMDAVKAFQASDRDNLVEIALDLEIDTGLEVEKIVASLMTRSKTLELQIQQAKGTVEWLWVHSDEARRIEVIKELCRRNGWLYVTDEQIAESVRYVSGMHPGSKEDVRARARKMMQDRRRIT